MLAPGAGKTKTGRLWAYLRDERPYGGTGGKRAAPIASLIATARLNGIAPEAYLRHVLERIATHPINRVADLLP